MVIVLLGYMGSGKSTVGKLLSQALHFEFYDLDELIEQEQKMPISSIFKEKGEVYFRKLETQIFSEALNKNGSMVLALGGGTPCYSNNMELLNSEGVISIYLKLPLSELITRLSKEKENRPLIKDIPEADLPEFIGKHLFERSFFYNQSDLILDCSEKTAHEVVEEIKKLL